MKKSIKRFALYTLVILAALACLSCTSAPAKLPEKAPPPAPRPLEGSKNDRFNAILAYAEQVGQCDVLVMGDSIVEGLYKNYHNEDIFAAGIQSTGVKDWLYYAPLLLDVIRPKTVILALGVNDSRIKTSQLPQFFLGYDMLCDQIKERVPELVVSTILPVRKGKGKRVQLGNRLDLGMIKQMNTGITEIARSKGYGLIDSHRAIADSSGMLPQMMTFDGVHLTREGYQAWERVLFARYRNLAANTK